MVSLSPSQAATFTVGDDQPTGVVLADGESLDNAAHISNNGDAVATGGGSPSIINRATGVIEATVAGSAIVVNGDVGLFDNMGTIYAANGITFYLTGNAGTFENSGSISSATNEALWVDGGVAAFLNSGSISGAQTGIYVFGDVGSFVNTATGTISGGPNALRVLGTVDSFTNAGSMSAGGYGIYIGGAVGTFTNSATGTLSGGPGAIYLASSVDTFTNEGTITSAGGLGVIINDAVGAFTNAATGTISGGGPGGVHIGDSVGRFVNDGTITGATAVAILGDAENFTNTGSLSGQTGVRIAGDTGTFDSSGTIAATTYEGVLLQDDVVTFANSGTITSDHEDGVVVMGNAGSFSNAGMIASDDEHGVFVLGDAGGFSNSGTISGGYRGVFLNAAELFTNSGTIYGGDSAVWYGNPASYTYFHNTATGLLESGACMCGTVFFPNGTLLNEGTIRGGLPVAADGDELGMIEIINSGAIIGESGTAIDFGAGGLANRDDFLRLLTGSEIIGSVAFGPGFDTLDLRNYQGSATLDVSSLERILGGAGLVWDDSANSGNVVIIDDTAIKFSSPGNYAQLAGGLSNLIDGARNGVIFGGVSSAPLSYAAAPESRAAAAAGAVAGDTGDDAGGRLWGTVFGAYGASTATGNSYSDTLGGLVAGAHTTLAPGSLLGGVVSVARSNFVTAGNGQTIGATTAAAGLYGETELSGLTLDYALLAGAGAHHSERQVAGLMGAETATADYASWFWSPEIGVALPVLEQQGASAEAGLRVRYIGGATGAYSEIGSSADISVPQQGINVLEARAELSGKIEAAATGHGPVLLTATAGALAQSNLGGSTLALVLPGGITVDSVTDGATVAGVYADVGFEAPLGDSASFLAGLGGELRTGGFRAVAARAGLSGAF